MLIFFYTCNCIRQKTLINFKIYNYEENLFDYGTCMYDDGVM